MFPDTTKMKKILKWKPTVSLLKGLKITIRSYKMKSNNKDLVSIIMNCHNGENI